MQPYYIHATKTDTTKHPIERYAYNANKACQIPRTPLRYTTHMEITYQRNSRKNTENKETNALANKPKIQTKHRKQVKNI